jgi:hypothetical protein
MKRAFLLLVGVAAIVGAGCSPSSTDLGSRIKAATQTYSGPPVFSSVGSTSTIGRITIDVTTPQIVSGLTKNARETFNMRLTADAADQISQFKKDFNDPDLGGSSAPAWTLNSTFTLPQGTERIQSVLINGYQYTGGAHGLAFQRAYMLDLKEGRFLTLPELFEPGTDILPQLTSSSRAQLLTRKYVKDDEEWVNTGTMTSLENFSIVHVVPEGLVVYFSDYQVGPHAIGPQTVTIPWSELTGVKKEYLP